MMETAGVVGSSSMMDSGVWHEALQGRQPPPFTPCPPSSVLESGATCELPAVLIPVHCMLCLCIFIGQAEVTSLMHQPPHTTHVC